MYNGTSEAHAATSLSLQYILWMWNRIEYIYYISITQYLLPRELDKQTGVYTQQRNTSCSSWFLKSILIHIFFSSSKLANIFSMVVFIRHVYNLISLSQETPRKQSKRMNEYAIRWNALLFLHINGFYMFRWLQISKQIKIECTK